MKNYAVIVGFILLVIASIFGIVVSTIQLKDAITYNNQILSQDIKLKSCIVLNITKYNISFLLTACNFSIEMYMEIAENSDFCEQDNYRVYYTCKNFGASITFNDPHIDENIWVWYLAISISLLFIPVILFSFYQIVYEKLKEKDYEKL
jgi:hypothetical protein